MFANYGKNFTFYFDTYGNVIGCTEPTTAASYVVMNKIYAEHTGGDFVIKADLYDLDGKKIEADMLISIGGKAPELVLLCGDDNLGVNASNPAYLEAHPEARQECYPLSEFASDDIEIIKEDMNHV